MYKNINEFIATALNEGYASAPRWWILRQYSQERYSKTITADLQNRAKDRESYGDKAGKLRVFDTVRAAADIGDIVLLAGWANEH